jgi:hypothetical protein
MPQDPLTLVTEALRYAAAATPDRCADLLDLIDVVLHLDTSQEGGRTPKKIWWETCTKLETIGASALHLLQQHETDHMIVFRLSRVLWHCFAKPYIFMLQPLRAHAAPIVCKLLSLTDMPSDELFDVELQVYDRHKAASPDAYSGARFSQLMKLCERILLKQSRRQVYNAPWFEELSVHSPSVSTEGASALPTFFGGGQSTSAAAAPASSGGATREVGHENFDAQVEAAFRTHDIADYLKRALENHVDAACVLGVLSPLMYVSRVSSAR